MPSIQQARQRFDSFLSSPQLRKDKYGNYTDPDIHHLWVGFRDWYMKGAVESGDADPEQVPILKDTVHDASNALTMGIEYAQEVLAEHDAVLGRTTRHNRLAAESIEAEISQMTKCLLKLRQML